MPFPDIPRDGAYLGDRGAQPAFRFAIVGDTHSHRPGDPADPSDTLLSIIAELNLLTPDFVIGAGDLIRGYTVDDARLRLEHTGAQAALGMLEMPFYPCIGNHDVREEVSDGVWREFWGGRYYSFDVADCHFVVLDAEAAKDVESVAGEQLEWLEADLAERAPGKRVFVTLHRAWWKDYPLHQAEWKRPGGRNDWNDIVDPILRRHDLQAVFCGHSHKFAHEVRAGVPHIVSGGAGGDINSAPLEDGGVSHYLWVSVRPDGWTWAAIVPGHIVGDAGITDAGNDFGAMMPWVRHPDAARNGWHVQRERGEQRRPQTFGARLRRLVGRRR